VHSFAAGTEGSSDLVAARIVAESLGLEHHERVYTADEVVEVLPTVVASIESFEPSLVRSAVPNYLLSELAAQHVKVVLTGEGADELFAGYDHLRDIEDSDELRLELIRSVEGLHNLNLQRCDRVTMAHGLEARVPFLDLDLIAVAQRVPIDWKLPGEEGQEKAILREAFTGWIPDEILWRRKEQFGDGSGTADVMAQRAHDLAPDDDWEQVRVPGLPPARSREELGYQRVFAERLQGIRSGRVLGRFATA
jgi:asparagine synthase (glutamine-hydrolysing)